MIPRIQTGSSFKGAGLYYLHDKKLEGEQERLTTGRVAWTYAINTLEDEPEAVLAEMRKTAFDQYFLKMTSGNRVDGRPTEQTVMTVALAWSPEQTPTREDMIEAGHSFLQHMKWEDLQVLFVAHNDTKHPHVHLIINRVHPETGMTMDSTWSKTRSQQWALKYERENGHVYCQAREAKYDRDQGRDPSHMSYREWEMWQEMAKDNALDPEFRKAMEAGEWDVLKGTQKDSRTAHWKETGQMRKDLRDALRDEVRAEFAPRWKDYALEKESRDKKAQLYDREARRAIRELRKQGGAQRRTRGDQSPNISVQRGSDGKTFIKQRDIESKEIAAVRGPDGRTYITRRRIESAGIEQIKERQKEYHARLREDLFQMRSAIASSQKKRFEELTGPALEKLSADRIKISAEMLKEHRGEKSDLRRDQAGGKRRRDLLSGYDNTNAGSSSRLTPEQMAAYMAHARSAAARNAEIDQAGREVTNADRARSQDPGQDPLQSKPGREVNERAAEKRDKDQAQEAKRQAGVNWYLAKRKDDRERGGGGGGRER
jgi:hypothetical protein